MSNKVKVTFENFTRLDRETLEMIYKWRTSEEISQCMENQGKFSIEDHLKFCASLKDRKDKLYYLIKFDGVPCGVYDYVDIDDKNKVAVPGNYMIGNYQKYAYVVCFLQNYILKKHGIKTVKFYVLKSNVKALLFQVVKLKHQILFEDKDKYYFQELSFDPEKHEQAFLLDKDECEILD